MLVDANLLLYAVDRTSPRHDRAATWLTAALNGNRRVGLPWPSIGAFLRISTHPRVSTTPLTSEQAWAIVETWVAAPAAWIPVATERTVRAYGELVASCAPTANLVTDAQLAALALEHGLEVMTADTDFARFPGVRWRNPLA